MRPLVRYVIRKKKGYRHKVYLIMMNKLDNKNWRIEVYVCDECGSPVSGPLIQQDFSTWVAGRKYFNEIRRKMNSYVNP